MRGAAITYGVVGLLASGYTAVRTLQTQRKLTRHSAVNLPKIAAFWPAILWMGIEENF